MPADIKPLRNTMIKMAPILRSFWEGFKQGLKEESMQALDLLVRERQGRLEAERRASKAEAKVVELQAALDAHNWTGKLSIGAACPLCSEIVQSLDHRCKAKRIP